MFVKLFDTELQAIKFSNDEAIRRGCSGVTSYWWDVRQTTDEKFAVLVGNDLNDIDENGDIVLGDGVVEIDESSLL